MGAVAGHSARHSPRYGLRNGRDNTGDGKSTLRPIGRGALHVKASPKIPFKALLDTAHALADRSGKAILPYFRRQIQIDNKAASGFDPVTAADRAAEQAICKLLAERHPDHAVLGEEFGAQERHSPYTWIIDPIDGTKAFITGMPLWGTLVGLTYEGRAILGVMDQPFTGERVWAGPDAAFWRLPGGRARRIETRACRRLDQAILATTSPDLFSRPERAAFERVKAGARLTRFGGDCYSYCLLAAGHIDLVIEAGLKPYDIVALIPIIERAGGRVTTWDGGRPENGGRILAAGDPKLHSAVLKLLAG
jgi:histidinol phosphatase-like enzyme (inositol monophosphatase family)